jgi:hypothetical protein
VNCAELFWSPLREPDDVTRHGTKSKSARQLAKETVDLFRSIHLRSSPEDVPGLEALGVVVVDHDNLQLQPMGASHDKAHKPSSIAPSPPNPQVGDPLNYETMIQRICAGYTQRFR